MRILQMSDLHLEFNNSFRVYNDSDADILMLNGDICVADYFTKSEASPKHNTAKFILEFFDIVSKEFEHVIYILGNHEHYHGYYKETYNILKTVLQSYNNIHILQNESIELGKFKILGTTLWTDFNGGDSITKKYIKEAMNDFRLIKYIKKPYERFTPDHALSEHRKALEFIDRESAEHDNIIVMTHHAPSSKSIHAKYAGDFWMNGGYYSDLDRFIIEKPQIKLWTHGHMHNNFDYLIGNTRVICNPHGYRDENIYAFNKGNIIDV